MPSNSELVAEVRIDPQHPPWVGGPLSAHRAAAAALVAAGLDVGIFLADWGISFLWRYTPRQIAARVANPEIHVVQDGPWRSRRTSHSWSRHRARSRSSKVAHRRLQPFAPRNDAAMISVAAFKPQL